MNDDRDQSPRPESAPDRDVPPTLSSVERRRGRAARFVPVLVLLSVGAAAATLTLQQPSPPALPDAPPSATTMTPEARDPFWQVIDQWSALRASESLPFASYATFLIAHRGWPGEPGLRRSAERAIRADSDPKLVADYFAVFPATTGPGRVRYAEALANLGRTQEAQTAARAAWIGGALSPDDEGRLTARFSGQFTPDDQDKRMERLLWDRSTASATRQLAYVTPGRKPVYAARLAFQTKAPDAAMTASAVGPEAERDAGYVIDRALWLRDTNQIPAARTWLGQSRTFDTPPYDPARYLKTLLEIAQGAAKDSQQLLAYQIALGADAAYPAGTSIRERPLSERDPYTSLVWLGGQMALKLGQPKNAEALFVRYGQATQSPGGQAKGQYWAGRAAQTSGNQPGATDHFANAALQIDQFYGQLATERLGKPIALPADPAPVKVTPEQRRAFQANELVRAVKLLGAGHRYQDQSLFVRKIANDAATDSDHVLIDELSREIARPDLAVITSRAARTSGARDPLRIGFPTIPSVPPAMASHWTIVHALSRQESQFDTYAMSPVGARGLMQLMPATAKEQAGKLGLGYDPYRLAEPSYNVMLGSAYFDRMLTYFGGNYVLAVASYNAGAGNVNKFIRANGDPRTGQVDVIDWIEAIPFQETRTYVQKVLENAVIYDLYNPARARTPEQNRLSYYLGKTSGG